MLPGHHGGCDRCYPGIMRGERYLGIMRGERYPGSMVGVYPGSMVGVYLPVYIAWYTMVGVQPLYHGVYSSLPDTPRTYHHPGYTSSNVEQRAQCRTMRLWALI